MLLLIHLVVIMLFYRAFTFELVAVCVRISKDRLIYSVSEVCSSSCDTWTMALAKLGKVRDPATCSVETCPFTDRANGVIPISHLWNQHQNLANVQLHLERF